MEKFACFTLSVAWRRSIHEWMNFDETPLPQWPLGAFGEQMRTFLVGDSAQRLVSIPFTSTAPDMPSSACW
jgi:hypothetical protein